MPPSHYGAYDLNEQLQPVQRHVYTSMDLFGRKKGKLGELILKYIQENLPRPVYARMTASETDEIIIGCKIAALSFEFGSDETKYKQLSVADEEHIRDTVIIPTLKKMDEELHAAHLDIQKKIKELENSG